MKTDKLIGKFFQVDAFTTEPYTGNPAGIYFPRKELTQEEMLNFAAEMNISETAFVYQKSDYYSIRYYTPFAEVPLCGHASLAVAHILYEKKIVTSTDSIKLKSPRYEIELSKQNGEIAMSLPVYKFKEIPLTEEFTEITGLSPNTLYKSSHDWIVALFDDYDDIVRAKPYFSKMKHSDYGHLIITASGKKHNCDYVLRCFAPIVGINEDPVTGSAHCALAPIWRSIEAKDEFSTIQLSQRGGSLISMLADDNMVTLKGNAITILEGEVLI